jgi:hypothetical protein
MRKRNRVYVRVPVEDRFWKFVGKTDGCWTWSGATRPFGYGVINLGIDHNCKVEPAHRVSWSIHFGPIPPDMHVLHKCDNPPCTNPDHLFLGSNADNIADMVAKGRDQFNHMHRRLGTAHGMSKLTDDDVRAIRQERAAGAILRVLSEKYDVSIPTIDRVVKRQTWGHIT